MVDDIDNFEGNQEQREKMLEAIRILWDENGNELSLQYANSLSTTRNVVTSERVGFFDKMNHTLSSVYRQISKLVFDPSRNNHLKVILDDQSSAFQNDLFSHLKTN